MFRRFLILIYMSLFLFSSFSEDSYSITVDNKYTGTYIPLKFSYVFENTLSFNNALNNTNKDYHDVLYVDNNECRSVSNGLDSYRITIVEFNSFSFNEKGDGIFLTDSNGNLYKRITKDTSFKTYDNYIYETLFNTIKDMKNVLLKGNNKIRICEKDYNLFTCDVMSVDGDDIDFFLNNLTDGYKVGVRLSGIGAIGYKIKKVEGSRVRSYVSNEVDFTIPLFSYTNLEKLEDMSKCELRLYRNLIYARHGYTFKSTDLITIFSSFSWYKPLNDNSKVILTKEEKETVNKCLEIENKK